MKDEKQPKNTNKEQGTTTADRAHHDVKLDKKKMGISNAGGQRSDQTSNKDNQQKRGK